MKPEIMSIPSLLAAIETLQEIQSLNPPTSEVWREASRQLAPLFSEMAKRTGR